MSRYNYLLLYITLLFGFVGFTIAADPSFSLVPASGAQLKLYCDYNINLKLNAGGEVYNGFQSTLKFDSSNINITTGTLNSIFTQAKVSAIEGGNRYRMGGQMDPGISNSVDMILATFGFKTKTNIISTSLNFVDINGNPVSFGLAGTSDGEYIVGVNAPFNGDILTGVYDATYNFVPRPCNSDVNAPIFANVFPAAGSNIPGNQQISFLTYDWAGVGTSFYWYSGLNNTILSNYVAAPVNVDNQQGVNSGTIKATISCATCSTPRSFVLSGAALNVTLWTGNTSYNRYTWDSADRGYAVNFDAPATYEIEKQITLILNSTDNPNESGLVHTGTSTTINFNTPVPPTITEISHINNSTFISPSKTLPIKFKLSDNLAGIDTGSVKFTIPTIMSGAEQLLTGHTYSGTELTFTLSGGSAGLGNSGGYVVEFYPKWDFPANTGITINSFTLDLAGNTGTRTTIFTTRPDCSFFGCNELLNINIMDGTYIGTYMFTGTTLIVTGANPNSPYPYLTGINNDIVMCGFAWTGAMLTGNIDIFDMSGNYIKGNNYTGNKLYITGLNFTISNGVIVVE